MSRQRPGRGGPPKELLGRLARAATRASSTSRNTAGSARPGASTASSSSTKNGFPPDIRSKTASSRSGSQGGPGWRRSVKRAPRGRKRARSTVRGTAALEAPPGAAAEGAVDEAHRFGRSRARRSPHHGCCEQGRQAGQGRRAAEWASSTTTGARGQRASRMNRPRRASNSRAAQDRGPGQCARPARGALTKVGSNRASSVRRRPGDRFISSGNVRPRACAAPR